MAAQEPIAQERSREHVAVLPRKAAPLQDPEDMLLLREKLNQIAVGRRYTGDNQVDHMEDSAGEDDRDSFSRRRRSPANGHFRLFLSGADRPSTPPSSPQPRDVLRKHLRMKNVFYTPQRSLSSEDNNSDTASDEPLEGMCVDGIEITPLPMDDETSPRRMPTHASVRLSVPEHLRLTPSSFSVLNKCPEGVRKRKSVHIEDKEMLVDGQSVVVPLKKVSSQLNVLGSPPWGSGSKDNSLDQDMEDSSSDPSSSPTHDPSSCS